VKLSYDQVQLNNFVNINGVDFTSDSERRKENEEQFKIKRLKKEFNHSSSIWSKLPDEINVYSKSKSTINSLLKKGTRRTNQDVKKLSGLFNSIGRDLVSKQSFELAIKFFEQELFCSIEDDDKLTALLSLAECYSELNDFNNALIYQNKYLSIAEKLNNTLEIQRAWATLGRIYFMQFISDNRQFPTALQTAETAHLKALNLTDRLKDEVKERELAEIRCRALLNLGLVYDEKGDKEQCCSYFESAINLARNFGLDEDLHRCQVSLADFYCKIGNYSQAIKLYDSAILSAKQLKNKLDLIETLMAKGQTLIQIRDYNTALNCFNEACLVYTEDCEEKEEAKQFLDAVKQIIINLRELTNCNLKQDKIKICDQLADLFVDLNCYSIAIEYYNEELRYALDLKCDNEKLSSIYLSLAQTYLDNKQYTEALYNFRKELECSAGKLKEEILTSLKIIEVKCAMGCNNEEVIDEFNRLLTDLCVNNYLKKLVYEDYLSFLNEINNNCDLYTDLIEQIKIKLDTLNSNEIDENNNNQQETSLNGSDTSVIFDLESEDDQLCESKVEEDDDDCVSLEIESCNYKFVDLDPKEELVVGFEFQIKEFNFIKINDDGNCAPRVLSYSITSNQKDYQSLKDEYIQSIKASEQLQEILLNSYTKDELVTMLDLTTNDILSNKQQVINKYIQKISEKDYWLTTSDFRVWSSLFNLKVFMFQANSIEKRNSTEFFNQKMRLIEIANEDPLDNDYSKRDRKSIHVLITSGHFDVLERPLYLTIKRIIKPSLADVHHNQVPLKQIDQLFERTPTALDQPIHFKPVNDNQQLICSQSNPSHQQQIQQNSTNQQKIKLNEFHKNSLIQSSLNGSIKFDLDKEIQLACQLRESSGLQFASIDDAIANLAAKDEKKNNITKSSTEFTIAQETQLQPLQRIQSLPNQSPTEQHELMTSSNIDRSDSIGSLNSTFNNQNLNSLTTSTEHLKQFESKDHTSLASYYEDSERSKYNLKELINDDEIFRIQDWPKFKSELNLTQNLGNLCVQDVGNNYAAISDPFNSQNLYKFTLGDYDLTILKIKGDGLCGFRSIATACCESTTADQIEDNTQKVRKLMIEGVMLDMKERGCFSDDDIRKYVFKKTKGSFQDKWCESEELAAICKTEGFNFQIQCVQWDEFNNTWRYRLFDKQSNSKLPEPSLASDLINIIQKDGHFNLVLKIEKRKNDQSNDQQPNQSLLVSSPNKQAQEVISHKEDSDEEEIVYKPKKSKSRLSLAFDSDGEMTNESDIRPLWYTAEQLGEVEIERRLNEYKLPTGFEYKKYDTNYAAWRLMLTMLLNKSKYINWTNIVTGEFEVMKANRNNFLKELNNLTNNQTNYKEVGQALDGSRRKLDNNDKIPIHMLHLKKGKFRFLQLNNMINYAPIHGTSIMIGKCRQLHPTKKDNNGIPVECDYLFKTGEEFRRHYDSHFKSFKCKYRLCTYSANAFKNCRPDVDLKKHEDNHNKIDVERVKGCTKEEREFVCHQVNPSTNLQCPYSFSLKTNFHIHERSHNFEYKCDWPNCNEQYSAFNFIAPFKSLEKHQISKHGIEFATCKGCNSTFRDLVDSSGIKFTALEQIEIHLKYNHLNFNSPLNYIFSKLSSKGILVTYSGFSGYTNFRPLDQLTVLYNNYEKDDDDPTKDAQLTRVVDETLKRDGLYMTMISNEAWNNIDELVENQLTAETSEFITIDEFRGSQLNYNHAKGNNVLNLDAEQLAAMKDKQMRWIDFNNKNKYYLKIKYEDVELLIRSKRYFDEYSLNETFFGGNVPKSKKLTKKTLKFMNYLNDKYNTNFFKQVIPTEEQLAQCEPLNNQLTHKLVEIFSLIVNNPNVNLDDLIEYLKKL